MKIGRQRHLRAAPGGLGARALWAATGGRGARIWLLEHGWSLGHEALAGAQITERGWPSHGPRGHGASVLGMLAGRSADVGWGLVPRAEIGVVGVWDGDRYDPPGALAALPATTGDVVLVMAQSAGPDGRAGPVHDCDAAIAALTARGALVVLPAGNGGADLDARALPPEAIVVGAIGRDHAPLVTSGYGARVDAWAPGERVAAIDSGPLGERPAGWTASFAGTSAAAAQIAGLLSAAQHLAPLDAATARAWLADPALGTPIPGGGVMPDAARWVRRLRQRRADG